MSVNAQINFGMSASELIAAELAPAAGQQQINHNGFSVIISLSDLTTPPISEVLTLEEALVAGSYVLDLTDTEHLGAPKDYSTLKLQAILVKNLGTHSLTVAADASDGYLLFGTAGKLVIPAGGRAMFFANDGTPDVDATHRNVAISGTGTDEFQLQAVFG